MSEVKCVINFFRSSWYISFVFLYIIFWPTKKLVGDVYVFIDFTFCFWIQCWSHFNSFVKVHFIRFEFRVIGFVIVKMASSVYFYLDSDIWFQLQKSRKLNLNCQWEMFQNKHCFWDENMKCKSRPVWDFPRISVPHKMVRLTPFYAEQKSAENPQWVILWSWYTMWRICIIEVRRLIWN